MLGGRGAGLAGGVGCEAVEPGFLQVGVGVVAPGGFEFFQMFGAVAAQLAADGGAGGARGQIAGEAQGVVAVVDFAQR